MVDRDELLARTDLRQLLDELAGPPARLGPSARWHCIHPDHPDEHPSVTVVTDRRGVERWRCWSGDHGGTAIDAVMVVHGLGVREALEELGRRVGMPPEVSRAPRRRPPPTAPDIPLDPAVVRYVDACARILWGPAGRDVREWLVTERGIPEDVLRTNRVGADPGPHMLPRPRGLPRGGPGAVLPALNANGDVAYCQLRYLEAPTGRSKYDNPAACLGTNPRVGWVKPPAPERNDVVVVCEGLIDACTAAAFGLPAAGVLGAGYPDARVATELARHRGERRMVVVFDADDAGRAGASRLLEQMASCGVTGDDVCPPRHFVDLNAWARHDPDWTVHVGSSPPLRAHHRGGELAPAVVPDLA